MDSDSQTRNRLDTLQIAARGALKAAGRDVPVNDDALPDHVGALGNALKMANDTCQHLREERDKAVSSCQSSGEKNARLAGALRDLHNEIETMKTAIGQVVGAPMKGPIKDRVRWLAEQFGKVMKERDDALHDLRVRTKERRDAVEHARALSGQLAKAENDARAAFERQEAENGRQAVALAEARRRLVEVTNERDRIAEERDAALGPAGGFVLGWLEKTLTASASDLDTAGEVLRAQKTLLDDSQADIHAALQAIREAGVCEGETLSEAVQALIADANAQQEAVVNAAKSVGIEADDAAQAARQMAHRLGNPGVFSTVVAARGWDIEAMTAEQVDATRAFLGMAPLASDAPKDPFAEVDKRTLHVVVTGKGYAPCGFTMAKGEAQHRVYGLRLDYNPRCGITIEQALAPDAVDATITDDLARACRMDRSTRPEANEVMRAAIEEIRNLRSAYNTAAQRADSNAKRRAEAAFLHGVLDDADIGFGPLRNRVEALVRMAQVAEGPRQGLDAEVDRALAQLDAAGFDVMNKGLGALEDALEQVSSMVNDRQRAGRALASVGIGWCEHGVGPAVEGLVRNVKNLRNLHDQAIAERDEARAASDQVVRDAKAKLERDLDRLREEAKGAEAEARALLDGHRREREEIEAMISGYTTVSGTLVHRVADALQACRGMPLETIDVIIDPGHVENAQARAMLAERFTAKMDEPLKFEEQVGLTIEYTSYGTVRVTQHVDVKGHRAAAAATSTALSLLMEAGYNVPEKGLGAVQDVIADATSAAVDGAATAARIADLEAQLEQARRLTQTHVERSEERYKAACEANDEVRRLKLAVVTLGRCAVELAGGDPRNV